MLRHRCTIGSTAAFVTIGLTALAGCSSFEQPTTEVDLGTADCAVVVKYEGTIYMEVGFRRAETEPLGEAQIAECSDTGPDAVGPFFPDSPDLVPVATFEGWHQNKVIALGETDPDGPIYRVMVNQELSNSETHDIQARLVERRSELAP